jgi:plasmid stabilization system protein ParE
MRIEWSELALDDLADIERYIAKDSAVYARDFVERIFDAADRLGDFPLSGRAVPEADNTAFREIIVQGYRVMYRTNTDHVLMLAVVNGNRDVNGMANKPWREPE